MIVSFILAGILVGPDFLGVVQSYEHIELLAELGIAVLLFLVGLKLDIQLVRTMGLVSLATGIGQVIFTAIIGFFIGLALGLSVINAIYVGVALTFSSTIIIVKLLSDKREVDSLHGRIAIGFLSGCCQRMAKERPICFIRRCLRYRISGFSPIKKRPVDHLCHTTACAKSRE